MAPLRYATQRDFAKLATVKGLRGVLERALAEGRAAGVARPVLATLEAELKHVDSPALEVRRASLTRLTAALRAAGLLLDVAAGGKPASVRPLAEEIELLESPVTRKRRRAVGQDESRSEARLLSIAPRAGPLAVALSDSGWKLSPRVVATLKKRGLRRVGDVLFLLPRCYEDRRRMATIRELRPGERGSVIASVRKAEDAYFRGRRRGFRVVMGDETGSLSLTYFQGAPWMKARFPLGKQMVVSGELRVTMNGYEMVHPEVEPADEGEASPVHFHRIVPIYPGLERQEQRSFRELAYRVVQTAARHLEDPMPETLRQQRGFMRLAEALAFLHFPSDGADLERLNLHTSPAHQRLAFDELFFLQLGLMLRQVGVKRETGIAFSVSPARVEAAKRTLPFQLTGAQERAVGEIVRDMARPEPMNRLLQGDVGSGKTAVALIAATLAVEDGYQVALMAPTEVLAEQHFNTFSRALGPRGIEVGYLKGALGKKERSGIRGRLASGGLRIAVGTHALFQEDIELAKLGLVLIDEQHRFGVLQRKALAGKGLRPDVLVMTATPIPRTLAMTLYGDLEVSVLDELPPGRTPIRTRVFTPRHRARAFEALGHELSNGHQAYVVYPLVEESEKADLADATQGAVELQAAFPSHRVGLLHGRMKSEEKSAVLERFRRREVDILVSTTVVEVGVDVPNATVMVIEEAERFGLSQLHQLRGRVGRGAQESHCFLLARGGGSEQAAERLNVLATSTDGFYIAEKDLELRGPGEFLGTRQSGLPELAVANLARDQVLLAEARRAAQAIVEQDPTLSHSDHQKLARALEERWEGKLALARVG